MHEACGKGTWSWMPFALQWPCPTTQAGWVQRLQQLGRYPDCRKLQWQSHDATAAAEWVWERSRAGDIPALTQAMADLADMVFPTTMKYGKCGAWPCSSWSTLWLPRLFCAYEGLNNKSVHLAGRFAYFVLALLQPGAGSLTLGVLGSSSFAAFCTSLPQALPSMFCLVTVDGTSARPI